MSAPRQDAVEDPYAILGVLPGVSPGAIREAYHRLVRESHPDLVIAQGLPPECVALATARIARINAAYDQIAKGERPGVMIGAKITDRSSPNHGPRHEPARIDMLVLHYTGMTTAAAALERLCDPDARVSAHYVVEENGVIWRLVPENRRAFHAGFPAGRARAI